MHRTCRWRFLARELVRDTFLLLHIPTSTLTPFAADAKTFIAHFNLTFTIAYWLSLSGPPNNQLHFTSDMAP